MYNAMRVRTKTISNGQSLAIDVIAKAVFYHSSLKWSWIVAALSLSFEKLSIKLYASLAFIFYSSDSIKR